MFRSRSNDIFSAGPISQLFERSINQINDTIERLDENYILNVNVEEYAEHLESKYLLDPPEIDFDGVYADCYEDEVDSERFPRTFHVYPGKKYKTEIIQFFLPVSGNIDLLKYHPASSITLGGGGSFQIRGSNLVTEFYNFSKDAAKMKQDFEREKQRIHRTYGTLIADINTFNSQLKPHIKGRIEACKSQHLKKNDFMSQLGVPLRKKESTPTTFSTPSPKVRQKIKPQPSVNEKGFTPEPTLQDSDYREILKLINDVGKNFERLPSTYTNKGEEDLRDHILMFLDPNFQMGSATGETFNKSGKTDIQLRYDSSVIFIAECKFWTGEKGFLKTIDQLLNYLSWRDTKASVILFVNQVDFTSVLEKVKDSTPKHSNYLRYSNNSDENWFNYIFHINGDRNREVKLAIQLYHLPKKK